MREKAMQRMRDAALGFMETSPKDPLRWEGILHVLMTPPEFITGFKEGFEASKTAGKEFWIVDEKAKADWTPRAAALEKSMLEAKDVPWEIQEKFADLMYSRNSSKKEPAAREALLRAHADDLARRFPEGRSAVNAYRSLVRTSGVQGTPAAVGFWAGLTNSPNAGVRDRAASEMRVAESFTKPIEMKFTAVDGREVDLASMRGKVVLIDFWATWCGPCIAELPNVKKAYAKYHAKGFEIVGISLDQAKDKQKLIDFTAKHEMPWPQHFDGKGWENEISTRYAISAIPAMFLLDKTGVVISTNARGQKLEDELKRLLGE
jgi:thiol-disulfide isomerase/thioredoxin